MIHLKEVLATRCVKGGLPNCLSLRQDRFQFELRHFSVATALQAFCALKSEIALICYAT